MLETPGIDVLVNTLVVESPEEGETKLSPSGVSFPYLFDTRLT